MATYKKKHKKHGNDKFVSYVIIGFAIAFFVILVGMILFKALDKTVVITVPTLTEMEEDRYLVYLYSDTCPSCLVIKDEVASFANSNNEDIKLYYLDSADLNSGEFDYLSRTYGVNGTPAMLTIIGGNVVDILSGSIEIPNAFNSINDGTYFNTN